MIKGFNWPVRLRSKEFWIALIPALFVLAQQIARLFGFELQLDWIQAIILDIVNSVFILISILGIAIDPTTPGIKDSALTMLKRVPESADGSDNTFYLPSQKEIDDPCPRM